MNLLLQSFALWNLLFHSTKKIYGASIYLINQELAYMCSYVITYVLMLLLCYVLVNSKRTSVGEIPQGSILSCLCSCEFFVRTSSRQKYCDSEEFEQSVIAEELGIIIRGGKITINLKNMSALALRISMDDGSKLCNTFTCPSLRLFYFTNIWY